MKLKNYTRNLRRVDGRIKKNEKENVFRRIQIVLKRDGNSNFYIRVKRTNIQNNIF